MAEESEKRTPPRRIKRMILRLTEKYCPFNAIIFQIVAGLITVTLLGAVLILGWMSSRKVTEVVTRDFNQQQLVLAQHAATQIENDLNMLKKDLSILSLSPAIQYFEKASVDKRMGITFSRNRDEGLLEIRYLNSLGLVTYLMDGHGFKTLKPLPEDLYYLKWAAQKENKGTILISEVFHVPSEGVSQKLITKMAIPVWQVSVDDTNPVAGNKFSGVLLFIVDTTRLIEKVAGGIKSGRTGYAWVIDEKGTFLYHPEKAFIGKNAFEARKEKKPTISFSRINEIQRDQMLTGKEGTSWYISGWHRGEKGEIKKLIAYTPVHFTGVKNLWSVAVAAPISEIEDAVKSVHIRHFLLQAVIVFVILLGGLTIVFLMVNWSISLEREVDKKTLELKKSEQRYKSLVENAEDIIFTVDYDGNFLSINKYGARFFDKSTEDIIGNNMSKILLWPGAEVPIETIKEVFDTKKGTQITHLVTIGEQEHWLNTNFRRLLTEEGKIYAVLGISRDITDRKKMEETSYHTEKLASMGTLSAGVAHEINNPLAIILGFADLLLEKTERGTRQYEILQKIETQGLKAKRVVENLLSFARYSGHKEEPMDINKGIELVLSVVENTLLLNKISPTLNLQDGLPLVKGCEEELQQVFFNIITNAVSAMNKGGILTISTRGLGNEVEIRFADTGCGIKKEHRNRVFDPLFTTKKIGEGTGLGLSVSYGIIMKYGGTISFETKTEDESEETGTTFIITLSAIKKTDNLLNK